MKSGTQPTDRSVCRGSMQRDFLSGRRLPVPARLTVLIAEASARDQVASRLEEALAAELMMAPALDPVMIAPLERIEEGSTDHLCLSGVNGPVVLLAWMDVSQAAGHWRRLGLQGHLVPRGSTANPDERRVYYIEMHRDIQVPDILGQLRQVLDSCRTHVVPLQLVSGRGDEAGAGRSPGRAGTGGEAPEVRGDAVAPTDRREGPRVSTAGVLQRGASEYEGAESAGPEPDRRGQSGEELVETDGVEDGSEWEHLDRLVDDLDALDI